MQGTGTTSCSPPGPPILLVHWGPASFPWTQALWRLLPAVAQHPVGVQQTAALRSHGPVSTHEAGQWAPPRTVTKVQLREAECAAHSHMVAPARAQSLSLPLRVSHGSCGWAHSQPQAALPATFPEGAWDIKPPHTVVVTVTLRCSARGLLGSREVMSSGSLGKLISPSCFLSCTEGHTLLSYHGLQQGPSKPATVANTEQCPEPSD